MRICCVQMCCVQMPMSAKKREEKKNLLGMGACRRECVACGWCCVWMPMSAKKKREEKKKNLLGHVNVNALHADALYGDVDGGSCRVGVDECKEKKKTY